MARKRRPRKIPKVLTHEQAQEVLEQFNVKFTSRLRARVMCAAMLYCGLRRGEVIDLRPCDINWESGYLELKLTKNRTPRNVPIPDLLLGWLSTWDAVRDIAAPTFFHTRNGTPVVGRNLYDVVRAAGAKVGIPWLHPHTFRHTCATMMLDDGMSIVDVQAILGHEDAETTLLYLHVRRPELAEKMRGFGQERSEARLRADTLEEVAAALGPQGLADLRKHILRQEVAI